MALGLGACGEDDPSGPGDEDGPVEAVVQDDPTAASPSVAPGGGATLALRSATFSGTMTGDFQAAISADGSAWIDLGSLNGITVELQDGAQSTVHGQQTVEAGTYSRVRLTIRTGQVALQAGGTIGGIVLPADVTLSVADGNQVVIERQVTPFTVSAGATARVAFELNSESWIDQAALTAGAVTASRVEAAVAAAVLAGAG